MSMMMRSSLIEHFCNKAVSKKTNDMVEVMASFKEFKIIQQHKIKEE